jgi:hypothetical protein
LHEKSTQSELNELTHDFPVHNDAMGVIQLFLSLILWCECLEIVLQNNQLCAKFDADTFLPSFLARKNHGVNLIVPNSDLTLWSADFLVSNSQPGAVVSANSQSPCRLKSNRLEHNRTRLTFTWQGLSVAAYVVTVELEIRLVANPLGGTELHYYLR